MITKRDKSVTTSYYERRSVTTSHHERQTITSSHHERQELEEGIIVSKRPKHYPGTV